MLFTFKCLKVFLFFMCFFSGGFCSRICLTCWNCHMILLVLEMPFPWIQLTFLVITFLVNALDPPGWKSSVNSRVLPCIWKLWFTGQVGKGLLHTSVCSTAFWPFMHITGLLCSWKCCGEIRSSGSWVFLWPFLLHMFLEFVFPLRKPA